MIRYFSDYDRRLWWPMAAFTSLPFDPDDNINSWQETQHLNVDFVLLGFSLLLELRRLQVSLPVEIPHCGDLSLELQNMMQKHDQFVTFYDVCERAASAAVNGRPPLCVDLVMTSFVASTLKHWL
ncbi:hypothetical protein Plhal304r1_c027g0091491 [Plasmopara halstedii]